MTSRDTLAWLGDFADELTTEQQEHLDAAFDAIAARYPDPDDSFLAEEARIMCHRLMVEPEDTVLGELRERVTRARLEVLSAQAAARQYVSTATGISEHEITRRSGVDRMTVRKWRAA